MQIPDSTICSLLNQGEEKGMEYLFTRYYKPLVLWAASFLNNIPQSEDLVQDFFIRLWKKGPKPHYKQPPLNLFFTLLYAIWHSTGWKKKIPCAMLPI